MKTFLTVLIGSAFALTSGFSQDQIAPSKDMNHSLKLEIERAISKGVDFLESQQAEDGSWSDAELPAISALASAAIAADPALRDAKKLPDSVLKSYDYLLSNVQPDGGIYAKGLSTYNTAISMMALLLSKDSSTHPLELSRLSLILPTSFISRDFANYGGLPRLTD